MCGAPGSLSRPAQRGPAAASPRGVVLCAPAFAGLKVSEYSANRIKKSVVGVGHADKTQVAMMVQRLLPKAASPDGNSIIADAADALATAICHAHYRRVNALIG